MAQSYELPYASNGLIERWGHWAPQLLNVAIVVSIGLGLRQSPPSALIMLVTIGLLAFVLVTWLLMRQHDRKLCESCAAGIPLNASEQAQRYGRRFRIAHLGTNIPVVATYLIVLIGSNWLLTVPNGRFVWAAIQSSMIYLITSHATHRRLQPWCPVCARGGGGEEPFVPEPDSPRGNGRQLV
ncbi:MAG: hypothetical protein JWN95_515 [Frankiales bacterium]|nr:hypothetical protein [Frankiales bacterium]